VFYLPFNKYYMQDAYTSAFYGVVKDTQKQTGYELPHYLEAYIVLLLASYVDKPYFEPKDSFAETFLNLTNAKELGDTCLFVSGVFPSYGNRKGLSRKYYKDIGQSSYASMHGEIFISLATHFDFLSDFIEVTVNSSKDVQNNLFR